MTSAIHSSSLSGAPKAAIARLLTPLVFALGCVATGPVHRVQVDAFADADLAASGSYVLVAEDSSVDVGSLRFREYAAVVERALTTRNLVRHDERASADLVVSLGFGVDDLDPQKVVVNEPVYGTISGGSPRFGETSFSEEGRYSGFGSSTSAPRYHVVGNRSRVELHDRKLHWIRLVAADVRGADGSARPAWEVSAVSVSPSGDLRAFLPVLVAALSPYIGESPGQLVDVDLAADDPSLAAVRGPPPNDN